MPEVLEKATVQFPKPDLIVPEFDPLPGEWKVVTLGQVLQEVNVRLRDLKNGDSSQFPVLSLTRNQGLILQTERFGKRIATEDVSDYKVVKHGQIVYNPYVIWEGAVHVLRHYEHGLVSPAYPVWETKPEVADSYFIDHWLRMPTTIAAYNRFAAGAVNRRRAIRKQDFLSIRISIPPLQEQQAIAHVLRIVQQAKEATEKIITATLEFKRSLVCHLFTYGPVPVSRVGQIQLKAVGVGQIPQHWEIVRLVDLLREPLRNGHSARAVEDTVGIRTLTLTAVTKNDFSIENTKITCAEPARVRDMWLKPGDIFVERANTPEYVGLAALYEGEEGFAIFPDLLVRIRIDERRIMPKFLAEFLLSKNCRSYYQQHAKATTGNFPKIDQGIIEKTVVALPPISEQKAIAEALRKVDESIRVEMGRLRSLTDLFQSLLHHLITGKVRVQNTGPVPIKRAF